MASKSLLIINKDDFKIFVSDKKKELEKLKKKVLIIMIVLYFMI